MTTSLYLGIWMDHSTAHLIEYSAETVETKTIESQFTPQEKSESLKKSENVMHNKEQHEQAAYYKKLGAVIKNYSAVILFGPAHAKDELYNTLKDDHHFANIKIQVVQTNKMSEKQQYDFVKEHFSKLIIH